MKTYEIDLQFLREVVALLDSQLRRLDVEKMSSPDPDEWGVFDRGEYAIGLGFVAIQAYLTAVGGSRHRQLLDGGPLHRCGKSFARICHEVANYWKHRDEWRNHGGGPHKHVCEVFAALNVDLHADYASSNALAAMVAPLRPNLGTVVPFLVQWAESLSASQETSK